MGLQHLADLFGADMTTVVEAIKRFGKGLMASRTEIALMTLGHLAMLMRFTIAAQRAFDHFTSSRYSSLLYQTHINLTHYLELFVNY